jgi:hypothetical protein
MDHFCKTSRTEFWFRNITLKFHFFSLATLDNLDVFELSQCDLKNARNQFDRPILVDIVRIVFYQ